jgi:RimJ/RimL family protein N-acetyltransferase
MFALTPRLTLRHGWPEDAPALARAIAHEAVVRNLAQVPWPYTEADARAFLSLPCDAAEPRFVIARRDGDYALVGTIALSRDDDGWQLGYWLSPEAWGRGYATEAGRAVLDVARHALGLRRVLAHRYHDNAASARVLEKLGFVETGTSRRFSRGRGGEVACVDYALTWAAQDTVPLAA